jgi:hypothetical protein
LTPANPVPTDGIYRGVPLHAWQSPHRVATVVRPAIDRVHNMSDLRELFQFACDPCNCPESRLLAAAKVQAASSLAASERQRQPKIDLELLAAITAGLDTVTWQSEEYFCTMFDYRANGMAMPDYTRREIPLDKAKYRDR